MKTTLSATLLILAACLAPARARACERPKPDRLVTIRFVDSVPLENVVAHAARSSCVDYRFDLALGRRNLVGPLQIEVMGADLDATYAILFHTMNLRVEGRGPTRKLVATGPEPEASKAVPRLDQEITRIDDRHARITRRGVDAALGSMAALSRTVRMVPETRNGKTIGFRVFSITAGTALDLVGFRSGDLLLSMNDIDLSTPDKFLEAYVKLKNTPKLRFGVERNGAPMVLEVNILPGPEPEASKAALKLDQEITRTDDRHASITRRGVTSALLTSEIARAARFVPETRNGKTIGFRLFSVRSGSALDLVGFRSGDLVLSMNDIDLATPDKALEAYTKVKTATKLHFGVERNGAPMVLEVNILPEPPPAPPQRHEAARADLDAALQHPRLRVVSDVTAGGVRLFSLGNAGPALGAAGFQNGDVIRAIGGRPVTTPQTFREACAAAVKTNRIEFSLQRMGQPTSLVVDVR